MFQVEHRKAIALEVNGIMVVENRLELRLGIQLGEGGHQKIILPGGYLVEIGLRIQGAIATQRQQS